MEWMIHFVTRSDGIRGLLVGIMGVFVILSIIGTIASVGNIIIG